MLKWMRSHKAVSILLTILIVLMFIGEFIFSSDIIIAIGNTIGIIFGIGIVVLVDKLVRRIIIKKKRI